MIYIYSTFQNHKSKLIHFVILITFNHKSLKIWSERREISLHYRKSHSSYIYKYYEIHILISCNLIEGSFITFSQFVFLSTSGSEWLKIISKMSAPIGSSREWTSINKINYHKCGSVNYATWCGCGRICPVLHTSPTVLTQSQFSLRHRSFMSMLVRDRWTCWTW